VPQRGIADIDRLGEADTSGPGLEVHLVGNLDGLGPEVDAAFYRLAQEGITNARRHARGASRITIRVEGTDDGVQLTVADDGQPTSRLAPGVGRGLVGMNERAELLGGRFEAGPGRDRGWFVRVVVPRPGAVS
jgi:signal transduction histidine kinase